MQRDYDITKSNMIQKYNVILNITIESTLSEEALREELVVALHDTETQYTKLDNIDDELKVIDYNEILVIKE
jgi:hypothetical protein